MAPEVADPDCVALAIREQLREFTADRHPGRGSDALKRAEREDALSEVANVVKLNGEPHVVFEALPSLAGTRGPPKHLMGANHSTLGSN